MASVRMTNELRSTICSNAMVAFKAANPEPKPSTAFEQCLRSAIPRMPTQIALKKMREVAVEADAYNIEAFGCSKNKLSNSNTIDKITLKNLNLEVDSGLQLRHPHNHLSITVELSAPVTITTYGDSNSYWGIDSSTTLSAFAVEDQTAINDHACDLATRKADLEVKRRTYECRIRELLDKCNTLKQLFEIWPAAENLVPQDKILKMHEKVTRKQRAQQVKEEIDFDVSEVNQVVLTAKLMGA